MDSTWKSVIDLTESRETNLKPTEAQIKKQPDLFHEVPQNFGNWKHQVLVEVKVKLDSELCLEVYLIAVRPPDLNPHPT